MCFAPSDTDAVGLAFANRSAVYSEMGYYEKALENIELARNNNYPSVKLNKLKEREDQCLDKMSNKPKKDEFRENEIYRNKVFQKIKKMKNASTK